MLVKPAPRCRQGRLPKPRLNVRRHHGFHGACRRNCSAVNAFRATQRGGLTTSCFFPAAFAVPRSFGCRPFFLRLALSLWPAGASVPGR
jgi:hypothetical protein